MKEKLSKRGQGFSKEMPLLANTHFSIRKDLYDPVHNANGYVNMGTAETHLIDEEVIDLLNKIHRRMELKPAHIHYDLFYGSEEFRTEIANYWQKLMFKTHTDRKLNADNVILSNGCTVVLDMLATMLGDSGDVFLIPAPYYSSFEEDINDRAHIEPVPVHCGPELDIDTFEKAYEEQKAKGKNVRAVLLSSPNNPVGIVYSDENLKNLIAFCMKHDLDIISDEIYAQTVFSPDAEWTSMLDLVPDEYLNRVHIATSFAKDFALSGLKVGMAISLNMDLIKGLRVLSYFAPVSTHTQALLAELLRAPELPDLIATNKKKLKAAHDLMRKTLDEMGVETLEAKAGIFLFADLAKYLPENTFEAEFELWKKILDELKINISPGGTFQADCPGWFRICYAHDIKRVEEACNRLKTLEVVEK